MMTIEQRLTHSRLVDLERVVELLNGQLHALQRELDQSRSWSSGGQLQSNFISLRRNHQFMSAICNRRVRPNIKGSSDNGAKSSR